MNVQSIDTLDSVSLRKAAGLLADGGVVVSPTDTVYGLLCDATNESAVLRVVEMKGRMQGHPLPVAVADLEQAETLGHPTALARFLIDKFWPGALTVVMPAHSTLPHLLAPDGTIGLRAPDNALVRYLLRTSDRPLIATSANVTGQAQPTGLSVICKSILEKADLVIEAGPVSAGKPSTVVDTTGDDLRVLREGALDIGEIWLAVRGWQSLE